MNKILNTLKSEIKAVMGSQLTKKYEVEKEPFMKAGLHRLWSVYRATRRGKEDQEVSIFMLDKKSWDPKKSMDTVKEDAFGILKKDPANLMKLRHPSILNLIEQPQEDDKFVVFVTEPIQHSFACL